MPFTKPGASTESLASSCAMQSLPSLLGAAPMAFVPRNDKRSTSRVCFARSPVPVRFQRDRNTVRHCFRLSLSPSLSFVVWSSSWPALAAVQMTGLQMTVSQMPLLVARSRRAEKGAWAACTCLAGTAVALGRYGKKSPTCSPGR